MKHIKNIIKLLVYPLIFIMGQFLIQYIFVSIFNSKVKGNLSNDEFLQYIKTDEYITKLNNYINEKTIFIIIITMIIFIPLFYNLYKKYSMKNDFSFKNIFVPIVFGVTVSLIYNITLYNLNNIINFTDMFKLSSLPLFTQIISSGICGPIIEELIFRGIIYNKLKTFNKSIVAIILTSLIFSVVHLNIVECIYTFGVSFILIYLYEKYKTLKAPIIMHMSLNITIILVLPLIIKGFTIFNLYLLIVSIFGLLVLRPLINQN